MTAKKLGISIMNYAPFETMQSLQTLVYKSCLLLNAERWNDFLGLCDPDVFRYRIENYSPEIRRNQCWADRDYKGMKAIFDLMPRHNTDHSQLTRQAIVYTVDYDETNRKAIVTSGLTVYKTQLDGTYSHIESGQTRVYAVGIYEDRINFTKNQPWLAERTVRLDTRQLDIGTHKPF